VSVPAPEICVAGAESYYDGSANTKAMFEAGSKLAKWAEAIRTAEWEGMRVQETNG